MFLAIIPKISVEIMKRKEKLQRRIVDKVRTVRKPESNEQIKVKLDFLLC